jgi:hypothetical protein
MLKLPPLSQLPTQVHQLYQQLRRCVKRPDREAVNEAIHLTSLIRAMGYEPIWLKHHRVIWCLRADVWAQFKAGTLHEEFFKLCREFDDRIDALAAKARHAALVEEIVAWRRTHRKEI